MKKMGPSTGVLPTPPPPPPRRWRERTSLTRFRVATSMKWKFFVPTEICGVCSLLRFDGKKWCVSRLSDSSSPLPFPDRSFFDRFKRSASIQWLGGHMQRATLGVIYTFGEIAIAMRHTTAVLNCCTCTAGREHNDRVEWVRRVLDPPATFSLPGSVSKCADVD